MATTGNSPTAGELATNVGGDAPKDVPEIQAQEGAEAMEARDMAGDDVSEDYAIQNPPPADEIVTDAEVEASEAAVVQEADKPEGEPGQTWAQYHVSTNHTRGWTFDDQRRLGVEEKDLVDNRETEAERTLLAAGIYWSVSNRQFVRVDNLPPLLRREIERSGEFTLESF